MLALLDPSAYLQISNDEINISGNHASRRCQPGLVEQLTDFPSSLAG